MDKARSILFVCSGNIIRSPLAEHLFRKLQAEAGLDGLYHVDSAGTGPWHIGEEPDLRMRRIAAGHGLKYSGRARRVRPEDFERFDLILAMDRWNYGDLVAMARRSKGDARPYMLREFDPQGGEFLDIPDPYYDGEAGFERTYRIVERSVRGLLDALQRGDP